jgi:hypothetical protein
VPVVVAFVLGHKVYFPVGDGEVLDGGVVLLVEVDQEAVAAVFLDGDDVLVVWDEYNRRKRVEQVAFGSERIIIIILSLITIILIIFIPITIPSFQSPLSS